MKISNYSYTNYDSYKKAVKIREKDNGELMAFLEYQNDSYFQEQYFIVSAFSFVHDMEVYESFNEYQNANKLFTLIMEKYIDSDRDENLDEFIDSLHSVEEKRGALSLLI